MEDLVQAGHPGQGAAAGRASSARAACPYAAGTSQGCRDAAQSVDQGAVPPDASRALLGESLVDRQADRPFRGADLEAIADEGAYRGLGRWEALRQASLALKACDRAGQQLDEALRVKQAAEPLQASVALREFLAQLIQEQLVLALVKSVALRAAEEQVRPQESRAPPGEPRLAPVVADAPAEEQPAQQPV